MESSPQTVAQRRNNLFARAGSPSASSGATGRPKSTTFSSPPLVSSSSPSSHNRTQSQSAMAGPLVPMSGFRHQRNGSRSGTPTSNTFAPSFIKSEAMQNSVGAVDGIEGENDFSGKRYVWLRDPTTAFVKGWVVEELGEGRILVQCDDGSVCLPNPFRRPGHRGLPSKLTLPKATRSRLRERR